MLDGYVSEKEQIENIRKWWNTNGKFLVMAIAIGLVIGFAWRQWQKLSVARADNAAMLYQQIVQADAKAQFKTVEGGVVLLKQHYSGTPYASLGGLLVAKEAVMQNQLPQALTELQWVIDHGSLARLKEMARINAARILLSQNKTNDAEAMIKKVDDKSFKPLVNWVQGDIDMKQGNAKAAQKNYQDAKNGLTDVPEAQQLLTQLGSN